MFCNIAKMKSLAADFFLNIASKIHRKLQGRQLTRSRSFGYQPKASGKDTGWPSAGARKGLRLTAARRPSNLGPGPLLEPNKKPMFCNIAKMKSLAAEGSETP